MKSPSLRMDRSLEDQPNQSQNRTITSKPRGWNVALVHQSRCFCVSLGCLPRMGWSVVMIWNHVSLNFSKRGKALMCLGRPRKAFCLRWTGHFARSNQMPSWKPVCDVFSSVRGKKRGGKNDTFTGSVRKMTGHTAFQAGITIELKWSSSEGSLEEMVSRRAPVKWPAFHFEAVKGDSCCTLRFHQ